jgi:TonB family protein
MVENWQEWENRVFDERFHLLRLLGASDSGAVFVAEDDDQGHRRVSIKLVPAYLDHDLLPRWERAAKVSHPRLIPILGTGWAKLDETPLVYAIMQNAEENLGEILEQRPADKAETAEVLRAVLEAIRYLHLRGLVHGHIKPANIMACGDVIKLSSDGVVVAETPQYPAWPCSVYHAPETKNGTLTPAFDLWGLGITLVAMLTQHPPRWEGPGGGAPVVPETLPQPFQDIARQCLEPDPRTRGTAADLLARLQRPLVALPVSSRPKPAWPTAPWGRKRYATAVTAVLALAMTLGWPKLRDHFRQVQTVAAAPSQPLPAPETPKTFKHRTTPLTAASAINSKSKTLQQSALEALSALPRPAKADRMAASSPAPSSIAAASTKEPVLDQEVMERILPEVPQKALESIHGALRVNVRVEVDRSGNVLEATVDAPGPSRYFIGLALQAARKWKFRPAAGGLDTREGILQFDFRSSGTTVALVPSRALKARADYPEPVRPAN